ncbi:3811_t:CDS:2, partial [Gigaspora margarita]
KEESFEHLTACEVDEARWLKKEYSIKKNDNQDLYTRLTRGKKADRHGKRNYMARGLIESDLAILLLATEIIKKVADLIITEW